MTFHIGKGQFITFPRFTRCRKPAYTQTMRDDLDRLARSEAHQTKPGDFWAFVDLEGKRRQVLRSSLLTQKEYDDVREKERAALESLCAKPKRNVGSGGPNGGGDPSGVAVPDAAGGGKSQDPGRER